MGLDFDVFEFCKKLRQNRPPPYQCPLEKCDKVYKSLCGLQYHLVHYDHDNPTTATPTVPHSRKKGGRARAPVPTGDIALQSPPKEALTFAEAQKVVQFEIDGKISRIPIDQPLPVMSLEEWEKKNSELEKPLPFVDPQPEPHVKLPEASYKLIPDYNERVCDAPLRPNAYIRFIEKSAEELDGEVEYDVDEEDTAWLAIINKMRAKQGLPAVSVDTLELLMDRLEKESYFQVYIYLKYILLCWQATQSGQQTAAAVDEDAVCCICMDGECQNTNFILFCDMCNLAVHQDCYGVPYIPEGQWLCRRCLQSPSRLVNCVLCPNTGGAFKQTDQGTWAHVVCALWIPEVRFANTVFLEPIDSIEMIPAARWKLQCMVCKQRGAGACIQCHKSNCYSAFHVTCAQQAGLYMKMEAAGTGRDPSQPVQVAKMAYCDAHTPAHVLQERRAQDSEGDSKSSDLTAIRQKGRDKIIQARRVLAMKRTWAPVVLVPTLPPERVSEVAQLAAGGPAARAQLMKKLLAYWTLKRHSRNGVPLLRRLQSLTSHHGTRGIQDGTVNVRELCNQLKYWQRIRQDLERARLLCELVRKRERLKAEYTRVWERCVLHSLRPERAVLHKLLRMLRQRDSSDIFTEPVDLNEVPDYSSVVKHPMDLSTMGKKLDRGEYNTIDDVEADFQLMIENCLTYNNKDTVFYKAGTKMREQCLPLFRQARRDVRLAGMPQLAGDGSDDGTDALTRDLQEIRNVHDVRAIRDVRELGQLRDNLGDTSVFRDTNGAREVRARRDTRNSSDVSEIRGRRDSSNASDTRNARELRGVRDIHSRRESRDTRRSQAREARDSSSEQALDTETRSVRGRSVTRGKRRPSGPSAESDDEENNTVSNLYMPADRTQKLVTPDKSPVKVSEPVTPGQMHKGLGLMGGLRKPTLLLPPSTGVTPARSFGADASLPTLSASLGRPSADASPKKKGRGRPRKSDKDKSSNSTDLFRNIGGGGGGGGGGGEGKLSAPVPASFLQYRGPPGEVGSDSDLALSRSSSSSSVWSQSCSSCTHYDDNGSGHSCSLSSSDNSSGPEAGPGPERGARMSRRMLSEEPTTPVKGRGTRSSSSKTPVKHSSTDVPLEPLQLVWAKCRGYPWYPALIIDPKIPKGFMYNGVPLPVPPQDVLNLKKNHSHEPVLYLVLFFDVKRTWQWLPPNKLELLGIDKSVDQAKLVESRKPTDRKAVKKAYGDAMQFRKQVDGEDK
ncbi:hypothetical protein ACJJTC_006066 [Scirpophaga incertulas]